MPVKLGSRVPTGVRGPLTPRPEIGRRLFHRPIDSSLPSFLLFPSRCEERVKKQDRGVNGIGNNPRDKHAGND